MIKQYDQGNLKQKAFNLGLKIFRGFEFVPPQQKAWWQADRHGSAVIAERLHLYLKA